jgi:hypothetical protein
VAGALVSLACCISNSMLSDGVKSGHDSGGDSIEHLSFGSVCVVRSKAKAEAVSGEARDDVKVLMKHLLPGGLSVCQEDVDALGLHTGSPNGGGDALSHPEEVGCNLGIQLAEVGGVLDRNYENMARVDGLDVHEREYKVVSMHFADWSVSLHYFTERTLHDARSAA